MTEKPITKNTISKTKSFIFLDRKLNQEALKTLTLTKFLIIFYITIDQEKMVMSKEERKIYDKAYREANKDKIKAYREANKDQAKTYKKVYYETNTDKFKDYRKANEDKAKAYSQEYSKTPSGKKHSAISSWKTRGLIHDNYDQLYEDYLACFRCEICEKDFKSTRDRQMDHSHLTKKFRWFLCNSCNTNDYWIKVLNQKKTT